MSTLDANTDRLNEALRDVEDAIASLKLGVSAEVAMKGGHLKFSKVEAEWVLSVVLNNGEHTTPLLKASRALRLASVEAFPALLVALRQAHDSESAVVLQATNTLIGLANAIRNGTAMGST